MKAYKERVQSITTKKYKPPKNAVGLYECIVTSTAGAIPEEREYEFFEKTYQQLCRTFGEKNVLAGTSHKDETTIHTHWFITPIFNIPFHSAVPPFPAQSLHLCQHSVGLTRRFTSGLGPTFRRWSTTKLAWIP